jgi:adenine-specific DNA-methyltransferase
LRSRKRFGLVFDEHIPEITAQVGVSPQVGALALDLTDSTATTYRVLLIDGPIATVEPWPDGGTQLKLRSKDLALVRRFGEPVYPSLAHVASVEKGGDKSHHVVINGENYHTLQLLLYLYEEQIDCIYLDPPYNTGAHDWRYNNRFVDNNDGWHHSKWLSMMEKRLRLARRLLRPDGVLIVMIDEHELHHLGMLLERVFSDYLRDMVSVVINSRGSTGSTGNFGVVEEQAIFVAPGKDLISPRDSFIPGFQSGAVEAPEDLLNRIAAAIPDIADQVVASGDEWTDDDERLLADLESAAAEMEVDENSDVYWRGAVRTGQGTSYRTQRENQFYPIYIDEASMHIVHVGVPLVDRDENGELMPPSWEKVDGLTPVWPNDEEGAERVWCFEPERMKNEIAKGNLRLGKFNPVRNTYSISVRRVRRTKGRFKERTIWWEKSYDSGSSGTNVLKAFLGRSRSFPFPKSIYATRDILATVVGSRPHALILDFFAGSGTTLHSTCLLNEIDNGSRRCILVTNNEIGPVQETALRSQGLRPGDEAFEAAGIFYSVTMPRCSGAISGLQPNGKPVKGRYTWAGGRPYSEGFKENVEFLRLDYLEPDELELGLQFDAVHPALWLAAGAKGRCPGPHNPNEPYIISPSSGYALLFGESDFLDFREQIQQQSETLTHVWLVTDSEEAFAEMASELPSSLKVSMLYRDYLRNFEINTVRRLS